MAESVQNQSKGIKRNDPDPRPVEGATNRVALGNQDPDKHYVWVSKVNDPTMNTSTYRAMGYHFTQYDAGGVHPTMGDCEDLKQGERVESFGMVLMECSKEHKAKIDQEGVPGTGQLGQQWADKIVEVIRNREVEPEKAAERARGITTARYGGDDRKTWSF